MRMKFLLQYNEQVNTLEVQLQTIFAPYNIAMIDNLYTVLIQIESVARYTTVKLQQNVLILHYFLIS